jgi:sugar phosphate isomerase/epimerase
MGIVLPVACSSLLFEASPLGEALRRVREVGFADVDLGVLEGWAHVQPSDLAEDYEATARVVRDEVERAGVNVVALNCGMGIEDLERRARTTLRLAEDLGADSVTFGAPPHGATLEEAVAWAQPILAATRDHEQLLALVEFHTSTFTEKVDDCVAFVEATGFGITFDTSHLYIGPAQGEGMERLLPYIRHVHVRDAGRSLAQDQLPWGTGAVDLPYVASQLASVGYDGRVSVEYIGDPNFPGDMAQSVLAAADAVRAAFAE